MGRTRALVVAMAIADLLQKDICEKVFMVSY